MDIYGTAFDSHLDGWSLEYGFGDNPTDWTEIVSANSSSVVNNLLTSWDVSEFAPGYYTLSLLGIDKVQNTHIIFLTLYIGEPEFFLGFNLQEQRHGYGSDFRPSFIAVDKDGFSYVTDHSHQGRILKFDQMGQIVGQFAGRGKGSWWKKGRLKDPEGIAVDEAGNIYVADKGRDRVVKLDAQGDLLWQAGGKKGQDIFDQPVGLALDAVGHIYVADKNNSRIRELTTDGVLIAEFSMQEWITPTGYSKHYRPGGIATDSQGLIYVTDKAGGRVLIVSGEGEPIMELEDHLEAPSGVMINEQGYIYVSDQGNGKIYKFDPYGQLVLQWGRSYEPEEGTWRWLIRNQQGKGHQQENHKKQNQNHKGHKKGAKGLYIPAGLATDSSDHIYVVDQGYQMIQLFGLPLLNVNQ